MRTFLRQNSLGLFFGAIFLAALVGQAFAGWHAFNDQQAADQLGMIGLGRYLTSASFAADVAENWQSEYLQFLLSWLAQSIAGRAAYDETQLQQQLDPVSWATYVTCADFWSRTLQNWQSEFLAVGSMAVLSIYLRQRGSPQSKPVGAAHASTGIEG
jgi:hypothetical protein